MPATPKLLDLVDELGPLKDKIQAGREAEKQAKSIQSQLVEILELKPDESRIVDGRKYQCVIEPQQNAREIADMAALFDRLGREAFLEHCSFPLAKVDELLGTGGAGMLSEARTGPRKFKLIRMIQAVKRALKKAA